MVAADHFHRAHEHCLLNPLNYDDVYLNEFTSHKASTSLAYNMLYEIKM